MSRRLRLPWQLLSFVLVGSAAAALHWGVVVALVSGAGLRPLVANVGGWLCAFGLSFMGHHRLSFRAHGRRAHQALGRFFLVSALGFALNQSAYALLLHRFPAHYRLNLVLVLLGVAGLSFVLGRYWAFAGSAAPEPDSPAPPPGPARPD